MSVLDRSALVDSPLADLHAIASELTIDGFRRLRRNELVAAILEKQGGVEASPDEDAEATPAPKPRRTRSRSRAKAPVEELEPGPAVPEAAESTESPEPTASVEPAPDAESTATVEADADAAPTPVSKRRPRTRRGSAAGTAAETDAVPTADATPETEQPAETSDAEPVSPKPARARRSRGRGGETEPAEAPPAPPERTSDRDEAPEEMVTGVVEVLPGGSGFVRVAGPGPSDADVYISSAQVKRCELVTGDSVSGPQRAPRRSERFASLIRVETINGRPASEQADSVRFDDLPSTLPTVLIELGTEDPTLKAIALLSPFGRGSRVTITGGARAGKTEALRAIAGALATQSELTVTLALAGVRPEEIPEWSAEGGPVTPTAAVSLAASEDAQAAAVEPVVDQARRLAARGSHAVVLIDSLDGLDGLTRRKLIASARNLTGSGSVTVIATATEPVGGETTVIALDAARAATGRIPALDALQSGTMRPELLVGDAGAKKIIRDRVKGAKD